MLRSEKCKFKDFEDCYMTNNFIQAADFFAKNNILLHITKCIFSDLIQCKESELTK